MRLIRHILAFSLMHFYFLNAYDICSKSFGNATRIYGDNGFKIVISGDSGLRKYIPQEVYTVTIKGEYPSQKFFDVFLVAVSKEATDEAKAMGNFQHIGPLQTLSDPRCPHIISTYDPMIAKSEVQVLWTAPSSGAGCIEFRATILQVGGTWLKEDGGLTLTLCEHYTESCCACGSARYQMTFTSLWSPFQGDLKQTRWSNITGSTHSQKYVMWMFGQRISKGLRQVCLNGVSDTLEEEMRQHIQDIRTVVKTTGIEWNEEYGLQQSRWSHFSVDERNHLLSLVTRMSPSPGWCAGISSFNLCLPNCTWMENSVINLFPWTTSSLTVQKVDEFHNITKSPIATLRIKRLHPRLSLDTNETLCARSLTIPSYHDDVLENTDLQNKENGSSKEECVWSHWSECSSSCGWGTKRRHRISSLTCDGDTHNTQTHACYRECGENETQNCKIKEWSHWTKCSCSFKNRGSATRSRKRFFSVLGNVDSCKLLTAETRQEEMCEHQHIKDCLQFWTKLPAQCQQIKSEGSCMAGIKRYYFDPETSSCTPFTFGGCKGNTNRFPTKEQCLDTCMFFNSSRTSTPKFEDNRCYLGSWSHWSACSSTCGSKSFRTRSRMVSTQKSGKCSNHKRSERQRCPNQRKCCEMGPWTHWTPCSQHSCNLVGIQERTRLPIFKLKQDKLLKYKCLSDVERRVCHGAC